MRLAVLASLVFLTSCGAQKSATKRLNIEGSGDKVVLLAGVTNVDALKSAATAAGLSVEGDVVLRVAGDVDAINTLEIGADALSVLDEEVRHSTTDSAEVADGALYLAKKDFGILEFWKENPAADGRGVVVGVFDDGISPNQSGFKVTTTGARKFLMRGSNSSLNSYTLTKNGDAWEGDVLEDRPTLGTVLPDLNADGKNTKFKARVTDKICLDLNIDDAFGDGECQGAFGATGEYFSLPNSVLSVVAEFDAATGVLKLSQPEMAGDSHGEGVATVMAGHQPGNPAMDGVAPGAQIVDYDLSEKTGLAAENEYTMGNILLGLEWLAKNGAEVANISYSLFFTSVEAQDFMSKATEALVKKYNIVLSFSAGNNGPGLGSLNRKVIYPDSVLVAGAFVSKELDERVWGVTGLPEEGRVIFYSSRGPGPLGDHGPTMISPLSSLTHSSPSEGFRAFNGTSSASPALAGAATVLISAIKAEGLKVDAATVVSALRLSGKRLIGEPFVAQGYGLPQVKAALAIYKTLIAGEQFANVTIRVNRGAQDGIGGRGILLLKSQVGAVESARVDLTGVLSALAPVSARRDLLVPVKLEYSNGIQGADELWVAVSGSRFNVEVDVDEVLKGQQGEGFGEIKIRDARSNALIAVVPVTVLDDRPVTRVRRERLTVNSQGSARLHVHVPAGVPAFRVKARMVEGDSAGLSISTFDTNRVRLAQTAFTDEVWVVVTRPGHHQVSLIMNGGTGREATVEFDIEPMAIDMRTTATPAAKPTVAIRHNGVSALFTRVELVPVAPVLARVVSEIGGDVKPLEISRKLTEKTELKVAMRALEVGDTAFLYTSCSGKVVEADGTTKIFDGVSYSSPDDKERTVTFRCMPFDHGITGAHGQGWELSLSKNMSAVEKKEQAFGIRANTDVSFAKQAPGSYEVWVFHPLNGSSVKLGVVELI
jgi:subtilisin family serine protease